MKYLLFLIIGIAIYSGFSDSSSSIRKNKPEIISEVEKKKMIDELYKEVKSVPGKDYHRNQYLYGKLLDLDPSNKIFKKKYEYYNSIVILEDRCGMIAYNSAYNRTKYPDTFEQIGAKSFTYENNAIVVIINYKAKNAFGVPTRGKTAVKCYYKKSNNIEYTTLNIK